MPHVQRRAAALIFAYVSVLLTLLGCSKKPDPAPTPAGSAPAVQGNAAAPAGANGQGGANGQVVKIDDPSVRNRTALVPRSAVLGLR